MDSELKTSLSSTWKEQIRQVAARNPRLAQQLWQNRRVYFDRFAHFYRQLANLPRKFRRKFLHRLATTLAGAALLLALGQALPAYAAVITVDGVTCTLVEAIDSANNNDAAGNGCVDGSRADVIDLQTDVTLSALLPSITSEISLEGNGHTIDGNNGFQVLKVQAGGNLTINEATITGGSATVGGGIYNQGTLTLNNSTVSGNTAVSSGGGIWNGGMLAVNYSTLSGNSAYGGGGIRNHATLTVNNSTFSGNLANNGQGGGIFSSGTAVIDNSTFIDNDAKWGSGIENSSGGTLTVNDSSFNGNSSLNLGSGIFNFNQATLTVNNSTFSGNSVYGGGGISNWNATATVNNSTLSGNTANRGGGIDNYATVSSFLIVNNSTVSDNSASNRGGGISNNSTLTVNNSTFSGNSTFYGGGISNFGTVEVNNSTLSGNSAHRGGGIFNNNGAPTVNLNRSLISGNSADLGAEVYNGTGTVNANNYNVVGYSGSARSIGFTPGALDIIPPGALATVLDTILADNGGPTLTHALVSGSIAIDAAPNSPCLAPPINGIDQRGYFRNVDGDGNPSSNECDSGSFEYASVIAPTLTPTSLPTITSTPRSSPTPTTTPHSSPTPTRTPLNPTATSIPRTPTKTPTPTQTPVPLVENQESGLTTSITDRSANPLMNMVVVMLLALGNLLLFRKGQG